jgi:hypothetical protein
LFSTSRLGAAAVFAKERAADARAFRLPFENPNHIAIDNFGKR